MMVERIVHVMMEERIVCVVMENREDCMLVMENGKDCVCMQKWRIVYLLLGKSVWIQERLKTLLNPNGQLETSQSEIPIQ